MQINQPNVAHPGELFFQSFLQRAQRSANQGPPGRGGNQGKFICIFHPLANALCPDSFLADLGKSGYCGILRDPRGGEQNDAAYDQGEHSVSIQCTETLTPAMRLLFRLRNRCSNWWCSPQRFNPFPMSGF